MFWSLGDTLEGSLRESFRLLRRRPELFLPKFFSTLVGSAWVIGFLEGAGSYLLYLLTVPLMSVLALAVSVTLAGAVREDSLVSGLEEAAGRFSHILLASMLLNLVIFGVSLPTSAGVFLWTVTGSPVYPVAGFVVTLGLMAVLIFYSYFLPVTLLDQGVISALRRSGRKSAENPREVSLLTVMSFALLGAAYAASGALEVLGYAGFVAGRLISAVFTTYTYTVSPTYYERTSS